MNNNLLKIKKNHPIESGNKKIFLFRKNAWFWVSAFF